MVWPRSLRLRASSRGVPTAAKRRCLVVTKRQLCASWGARFVTLGVLRSDLFKSLLECGNLTAREQSILYIVSGIMDPHPLSVATNLLLADAAQKCNDILVPFRTLRRYIATESTHRQSESLG